MLFALPWGGPQHNAIHAVEWGDQTVRSNYATKAGLPGSWDPIELIG